ncbi:MAG TPA: YXWGXW repeat-containing protein [Candidatus Acidoferrales bacterium]|nr:YXWGXW repeat-containing protein [Candidatus Acidoferrales bacterium]
MRFGLVVRSMLVAILLIGVLSVSGAAMAQVRVAITVAPPVLPVYEQPICPGDGYIWTPGYWDYNYDVSDYYWVPGTWVLAPEVGFLWTPPWWGWNNGAFVFTAGFWGPTIGFYGGINYGFGYFGTGFVGGRWEGGHFFYNTAVWHVGEGFHNVYNEHVDIRNDTHVSFNGHGGVDARPTREEEAAAHERHIGPVAAQTQHIEAARADEHQRASVNHGRPEVVATARPGDFKGNGVVRGGEAGRADAGRADAGRGAEGGAARSVVHPNDLPARERGAAPNTGDPKLDKKYQQQQDKLAQQQDKERQKLQAQQDKEHQQLAKQKADDARTQQLEQKHAQQTQQLQQRHAQQTQQMQQRQSAPRSGGRPR